MDTDEHSPFLETLLIFGFMIMNSPVSPATISFLPLSGSCPFYLRLLEFKLQSLLFLLCVSTLYLILQ